MSKDMWSRDIFDCWNVISGVDLRIVCPHNGTAVVGWEAIQILEERNQLRRRCCTQRVDSLWDLTVSVSLEHGSASTQFRSSHSARDTNSLDSSGVWRDKSWQYSSAIKPLNPTLNSSQFGVYHGHDFYFGQGLLGTNCRLDSGTPDQKCSRV